MNTLQGIIRSTVIITVLFGVVGCSGMSRSEKNAAVGAVGGAVIGDVLDTPGGALGGAVVGGVIGSQVGKDKK